jgi:hypothetical protein
MNLHNLHRRTLPILFVLVSSVSEAGDTKKPNLCEPEESVVFSCSISKKIVSLCSTRVLSADSGRLTYRFGSRSSAPELTYPTEQLSPAAAFATYFESWAKGMYSVVQFQRGEYLYSVYNRSAVFEEDERSNGGGVSVRHKGKLIADHRCADTTIEDRMRQYLSKLGLPKADGSYPPP